MLVYWPFIALGLSAAAIFMLTAAVIMNTRVLGRILAVERQLLRYQTEVEQLDTRITREVKARAGLVRAAEAEETRSIKDEAQARLHETDASVVSLERPKRAYRR